jgi:hypothetical protein
VAELLGADTDAERVIRWLIALIVFAAPSGHSVNGRDVGAGQELT